MQRRSSTLGENARTAPPTHRIDRSFAPRRDLHEVGIDSRPSGHVDQHGETGSVGRSTRSSSSSGIDSPARFSRGLCRDRGIRPRLEEDRIHLDLSRTLMAKNLFVVPGMRLKEYGILPTASPSRRSAPEQGRPVTLLFLEDLEIKTSAMRPPEARWRNCSAERPRSAALEETADPFEERPSRLIILPRDFRRRPLAKPPPAVPAPKKNRPVTPDQGYRAAGAVLLSWPAQCLTRSNLYRLLGQGCAATSPPKYIWKTPSPTCCRRHRRSCRCRICY